MDNASPKIGPAELIAEVTAAMNAGGPDNRYIDLAAAAESLSDMVGWSEGPIDSTGALDDRLHALQQSLRRIHELQPNSAVATLHDALASLREAVINHDQDLANGGDNVMEDGEF